MPIAPVVIDFLAKGTPELSRAFKNVEGELARMERDRVRHTDQAARQRERIALREAREKERIEKASVRATEREHHTALREFERAEKQKTRTIEREAKERARLVEREARAEASARRRFANTISGAAGGAIRSSANTAALLGGAVLGLGGGFAVADSVSKNIRLKGTIADIQNSGYIPGGRLTPTKEIKDAVQGTAIKTGLDVDTAAEGLQKFVGKTGNLDLGVKLLDKLSVVARATGSSLSDVADAAGDVFNADTTQSADNIVDAMRIFVGQGKLGAVEMRDLASQMAKLGAGAMNFGGDRRENLATMGALAQAARAGGGAASADEAATSAQRFGSDVAEGAHKFAALGIKVKDGKVLRGPQAIIKDTLKATGGDVTQLGKLFGERSVRAVAGFADIYRKAGGGDKGLAAVDKEFEKFKKAAQTEAQEKEAFTRRMQEDDAKIGQAMQQLHVAIGTHLVPKLSELIPKLTAMIPAFERLLQGAIKLAEWIANNPWKAAFMGIGGRIGAAIAAEIAGSKLREVLNKALTGGGGGDADKDPLTKGKKPPTGIGEGMLLVGATAVGAKAAAGAIGDMADAEMAGHTRAGQLLAMSKGKKEDRDFARAEFERARTLQGTIGEKALMSSVGLVGGAAYAAITGGKNEARERNNEMEMAHAIANNPTLIAAFASAAEKGTSQGIANAKQTEQRTMTLAQRVP